MSIPNSQQQYQLVRQAQGFSLQLREGAPIRAPGAGEVLLKVRATSLNRRDIMVMKGFYPVGPKDTLVPLSDGAGEIIATGPGVTRFKEGDRAAAIFFQRWMAGRPGLDTGASALGGALDGMLAQYVTLSETGLVPIAAHHSFEDAASLPCAAVTAWHGLVSRGRLQAGDNVLLQGTGGVSVFGLQIAAAAGARPIITSSSDAKLERAKQLGHHQLPDHPRLGHRAQGSDGRDRRAPHPRGRGHRHAPAVAGGRGAGRPYRHHRWPVGLRRRHPGHLPDCA